MLRKIVLFPFLILPFFIIAQVKYESGYIIDNQGNRSDVYIKNSDWSNNPTEFKYKASIDDKEVKTGTLQTISAFGISNNLKYVRQTFNLDISSNKTENMSWKKEPEFRSETGFLKQLVEGKADLYQYQQNDLQRYFFSIDEKNVIPLVSKKYKKNNQELETNDAYKKVLFDQLKCESIDVKSIRNLNYNAKSLISLFENFNLCSGTSYTTYKNKISKGKFNLWVKGGVFNSSFDFIYEQGLVFTSEATIPFNNQSSIRFGAELEYIAPFGNNKWAIFLEPTYQSFDSTADEIIIRDNVVSQTSATGKISYSYLNLPLGIRHYMYLSPKSSIFLNAGINAIIDFSGEIEITTFISSQNQSTGSTGINEIDSSVNLIFGIGYNYNKKFSLEVRIDTTRKLIDNTTISANYASVGMVLGYKLL